MFSTIATLLALMICATDAGSQTTTTATTATTTTTTPPPVIVVSEVAQPSVFIRPSFSSYALDSCGVGGGPVVVAQPNVLFLNQRRIAFAATGYGGRFGNTLVVGNGGFNGRAFGGFNNRIGGGFNNRIGGGFGGGNNLFIGGRVAGNGGGNVKNVQNVKVFNRGR